MCPQEVRGNLKLKSENGKLKGMCEKCEFCDLCANFRNRTIRTIRRNRK